MRSYFSTPKSSKSLSEPLEKLQIKLMEMEREVKLLIYRLFDNGRESSMIARDN